VLVRALGEDGLTICYDVRFAPLYSALARAGAEIIAVPAAFTVPTGQAHWETLLRARAIETHCYVIAPAQGGTRMAAPPTAIR
jgi:predicted amidohydrolase